MFKQEDIDNYNYDYSALEEAADENEPETLSLRDFKVYEPVPPYFDYNEFPGYFSDQFSSSLQTILASKNVYKPGNWIIGEQENYDMTNLPLRPLDIERDILDDSTIVLIGRRRSGKTFMTRWILYHLVRRFPLVIVITGTKMNNFWADYVHPQFIHNVEFMNDVIRKVLERQQLIVGHPDLGIDPRICIILDDILKEKHKVRGSTMLGTLFTDGRHYKVCTFVTCQNPKGIPPDLRENTDVCIIFRQFQKSRKEAVACEYLDYIDDKKIRDHFLWNKTGNVNPDTLEKILSEKEEAGEGKKVPVALVVLQSKLTEDMQEIFKQAIAEVPDKKFLLGDQRYIRAMLTGDWAHLKKQTMPQNKNKNISNASRR